MRELKFRAWVARYEKYMPIISITWDTSNRPMLIKLEDTFGDSFVLNSENVLLEQYTGLKDKNGKEIYEGDIVATAYKTKCRTDEDVFGEWHDEWDEKIKGKFEVKYSRRATFGISYVKDPVVIRDLWELGSDIKVIGNIHENKELLGEE